MVRFWPSAIAAGLVSASIYMLGHGGTLAGMVLIYLAPAPLFAAGLSLGWVAAVAAGTVGTTLALLWGGQFIALSYVLTSAIPVALLSHQALQSRQAPDGSTEWYPPGLLVIWLMAWGVIALSAVGLFLASTPNGIEGTVIAFALQVADALQVSDRDLFARLAAPVLPGLVVGVWMLTIIGSGALAQAGLAHFSRARRPAPDIAEIDLPTWVAVAGALAGVAGIVLGGDLGYFARNLIVIMAIPYFLQGLAVIHLLARRTDGGGPMLAIFYVTLMVLSWVAIAIAVLGLVEQIAGIRQRLMKLGKS